MRKFFLRDLINFCTAARTDPRERAQDKDHQGITLEQEYAINNRLYDEYLAFKYDSAYKYVNRNFIIAKQLNNKKLYTESTFNLVHILSVSGLFDHAYVLIDSIDVRELSGQNLQDYYQTYSDLVLFSTEFSVGTDFYSDNLSKILFYRKKLRESILDKNSLSAALIWQR